MLKTSIQNLMRQQYLSEAQIHTSLDELIANKNCAQGGAFLSLLNARGESVDEITAFVKYLRSHMISIPVEQPVLDIVGTGGDGFNTINISTGSALIAASIGIPVMKHGNRSVSSLSGSADVIEALEIPMHDSIKAIQQSVSKFRFAFCYAPYFHPVLAELKSLRTQLGLPTIFNLLGPMLNPASPSHLMMGVANPKLMPKLAKVLKLLGTSKAMLFHGQGLDEISTLGPIDCIQVENKQIQHFVIDPSDYGLRQATLSELQGADVSHNATALENAFSASPSALLDTLLLNAGIATAFFGVTESIQDGIDLARTKVEDGTVSQFLNQLRSTHV